MSDPSAWDAGAEPTSEDLLSALEVIEEQPLAERAAGYAALHEELSRRLAAGPGSAGS